MIRVSYTICPEILSSEMQEKLMHSLPEEVCLEAGQIMDQSRKIRFLAGRLMLMEMLQDDFSKVGRTNFGKPYLVDGSQFNISHSNRLVVCAVSDSQCLGVDSEKVKEVDLQDYDHLLNDEDRYMLDQSSNKMKTFHRIWTQKESLAKADGRGVFIDMKDIILERTEGYIKGEAAKWRLISFNIAKDYEVSVCHEWGKEDVKLRKLQGIWGKEYSE